MPIVYKLTGIWEMMREDSNKKHFLMLRNSSKISSTIPKRLISEKPPLNNGWRSVQDRCVPHPHLLLGVCAPPPLVVGGVCPTPTGRWGCVQFYTHTCNVREYFVVAPLQLWVDFQIEELRKKVELSEFEFKKRKNRIISDWQCLFVNHGFELGIILWSIFGNLLNNL